MKWTEDDEKQAGAIEPEGIYPFEIVESEEKVSTNNNSYINVKLQVFVDDVTRTMYDNIMPQMPGKMRSFCETLGLERQLRERTLSATDCGAGEGFIRIAKKLNKDGYPQVEGYLAQDPRGASGAKQDDKPNGVKHRPANASVGDDIPF